MLGNRRAGLSACCTLVPLVILRDSRDGLLDVDQLIGRPPAAQPASCTRIRSHRFSVVRLVQYAG
jgi:hypothetical protein